MTDVITHMRNQGVSHGDIYAHNVLFDDEANILVGDFGATSIYDSQTKEMLNENYWSPMHLVISLKTYSVFT
ncbi:hypothetical protein [Photobacterium leiognathi]|uniref:hypothetical protein n=1 Tax=Photobacterium leiognathi TaxID=553611 RepID=UPI002739A83F|nr:hypothetical protein [Photobacterium leiognathi]